MSIESGDWCVEKYPGISPIVFKCLSVSEKFDTAEGLDIAGNAVECALRYCEVLIKKNMHRPTDYVTRHPYHAIGLISDVGVFEDDVVVPREALLQLIETCKNE